MEPREIYRLAYRIARCSLSIRAWADDFHEAYEFDDDAMTTGGILKRIARIDRQREAYTKSLAAWGTLEGDDQLIDDIDRAAGISLLAEAISYQSVMHRALSRWSTTQPGVLGQTARRDFLNLYSCLLVKARTERLQNPSRFQLRHHWLTRSHRSGKGE